MKITLLGFAIALFAVVPFSSIAHAQMMGNYTGTPYTATTTSSSDATGQALWNQLSAKQISCSQLTDADFDALGDYFMGSVAGNSHESMDQWMTQSLGEQGDTQMHITMGKRISGCDPTAVYPQGGTSFFPTMMGGWGMMGGYGGPFGDYSVGYREHGFQWAGMFAMVLVWAFAIIGIIATVRWIIDRTHKK
ncbi:MAG TPA: hypothetical protein VMV38_00715 [Candidatus Paceibacterota bacterium]|nr:hypothetical protein [Candidatus Paceibacterota bacterium]